MNRQNYKITIKDCKNSNEKFLKSFFGSSKHDIWFTCSSEPTLDEQEDIVLNVLWDKFEGVFGEDMSESKLGYIYSCIHFGEAKKYLANK
jgi:hypothetical protein